MCGLCECEWLWPYCVVGESVVQWATSSTDNGRSLVQCGRLAGFCNCRPGSKLVGMTEAAVVGCIVRKDGIVCMYPISLLLLFHPLPSPLPSSSSPSSLPPYMNPTPLFIIPAPLPSAPPAPSLPPSTPSDGGRGAIPSFTPSHTHSPSVQPLSRAVGGVGRRHGQSWRRGVYCGVTGDGSIPSMVSTASSTFSFSWFDLETRTRTRTHVRTHRGLRGRVDIARVS